MTHPFTTRFPRALKAAAVEAHFGSSIVECEGTPSVAVIGINADVTPSLLPLESFGARDLLREFPGDLRT